MQNYSLRCKDIRSLGRGISDARKRERQKKHKSAPEISLPGRKRESRKNRAFFAPNKDHSWSLPIDSPGAKVA